MVGMTRRSVDLSREVMQLFYTDPDFKTKKALKEAVQAGKCVTVYAPGLGTPPDNGKTAVGGPHGVHKWYAEVQIAGGQVVAVK